MKFETLVERLHINSLVLNEINSWEADTELSKLLKTIRSAKNQESFLDHYAEAMVARYFIIRGCSLKVEVLTVNGRTADFRVAKDKYTFFVHIKRLNLEQVIQKELKAISRLRNLRKIHKAVDVKISLLRRLTDNEMQEVYRQAKECIKNSKVDDRITIKNATGITLAKCEVSPKKGKGKNGRFDILPKLWAPNDRKRLYDKLSQTYKQFMPESLNVILVTSRLVDAFDDFEKSLLDSTGFWSNEKHPDSNMVGWFKFDTDDYINFRIWYRDGRKIPVEIKNIFRGHPFSDGDFYDYK